MKNTPAHRKIWNEECIHPYRKPWIKHASILYRKWWMKSSSHWLEDEMCARQLIRRPADQRGYLFIWSPGKKTNNKKLSLSREPVPQAVQSDRCLLLLFLSLWPCLLVWPLRELSRTLWFIGCLSRGKQERCKRLIARSYNSDCVCLLCFDI